MYRHILVATDGSPLAMKAVRAAVKLAGALRARITAVYVMPPFVPPTSYEAVAFHVSHSDEEYDKSVRKAAVRPRGHGLARAPRDRGRPPGKRDPEGPRALEDPRSRREMTP